MAEFPCYTASPEPAQAAASSSDADTTQYWCYHCEKSVSIETLPSLPDVICRECKNGFVESIPPSSPPSLTLDHADDPSFGSQFLQLLRLIAQAAHDEDEDAPQQQASGTETEGDFLRIELDGWDNDDDGDGDDDGNENDENQENNRNDDDEGEEENGGGDETEEGEDRSDNDDEENGDSDHVEYLRRRRGDLLRLRLREFATRAGTGRNRILDWADILMELPESDRYVGNPEDYVDASGYEALLQNLAENDGGRRGAPPAAKAALLELPMVEISSEQEAIACAICKDVINVGETATKIPCGHGYHGECIMPWLGSRNTCPVCRFELPTDDPEYEEERKKRVSLPPTVGGASGSSGENSSSG